MRNVIMRLDRDGDELDAIVVAQGETVEAALEHFANNWCTFDPNVEPEEAIDELEYGAEIIAALRDKKRHQDDRDSAYVLIELKQGD